MIPTARREGSALPPFAGLLMALALALPGPAPAAPPAGSAVDNTAHGSALDSLSGLPIVATSNTVTAIVQPLDAVVLFPGRGGSGVPGSTLVLRHVLRNLGNATADVRLDAADLAGDGFDAAAMAFVHDRDADGTSSTGDSPVANGGVITIAAGDSASLLLLATLPAGAPVGARALVSVTATTLAQGASDAVTDTLAVIAPVVPPALAFYDGAAFARVTHETALGAALWLQAKAPQADRDTTAADTIHIALASRRAGDHLDVVATETGPHTGVFRASDVPTAPWTPGNANHQANALLQARGDQVTATLAGFGADLTRASVWVEPGGTVFDSRTGSPVAGVRVRLVDETGEGNGAPGQNAWVWQDDGTTPAPAEVVTALDGRFRFPLVAASTYRLEVTPPAPWSVPSRIAIAALPGDRVIDAAGSYGGAFTVSETRAPIVLDVPADVAMPVRLFAEKSVTPSIAEWGDVVEYRLKVANRSDSLLTGARVDDVLPQGFAYVAGSARRGRAAAAVTADARGGLAFPLDSLPPRAEIEIRYRARIGAGARRGDATTAALASAGEVRSNPAPATVRIEADAFDDAGTVTGRVALAGAANASAIGVAGVRLFMDDGTWAVTDEAGHFSFTGVTPRTHALKLDPVTLPAGARVVALDHRAAGSPGVRFVDVTRGDLVRADFALAGDSTVAASAERRRGEAAARGADERTRALALAFDPHPGVTATGDARALPAARVVTGEGTVPVVVDGGRAPLATAVAFTPAPETGAGSDALPAAVAAPVPLEQRLGSLGAATGFVGIADRDTIATGQLTVTGKTRVGEPLALSLNGVAVPASRVGRKLTAVAAGVQAVEWVGIALSPGENTLELSTGDAAPVRVRVVAPGAFAKLVLSAPRGTPADGRTPALLTLRATDAAGVAIGAHTLVTLDAAPARFETRDLDPAQPGVQVALDGGIAQVPMVGATAGSQRVVASSGAVRTSVNVEFLPDLRPLLLVGAAEGVVSLNGFPRRGPAGAAMAAGFEAPISQFASSSRDGELAAGAHGALFARGRVGAGTLLTLGWDSDAGDGRRQFRDLQPSRGAPVLGDASTRGYEAQSTGQLYAKVEQPGASVLYGDFVTGGNGTRVLGNYGRSLTGAMTDWSRGGARVLAFTSRTRSTRITDERPGNGTSGPYRLAHAPLVENSERVEIVVRDRAQPAVVLSTESRQRFVDYEVDALTGRILFRSPVPSLDADLNPVSVRVSYESESGGAPAWVHGVDARAKVAKGVEVGGVYADDHDPSAPFELRSLSASVALGGHTTFESEWATTRQTATGAAGDAGRFEFKHDDAGTQARVWGVGAAKGFDNPGAGISGGRSEAGAHVTVRLPSRTRLLGELLRSADAAGHDVREGALLSFDRALGDPWRGELGVRVSRERRDDGMAVPAPSAAVRGRLTLQLPQHPQWSGYGEFEQETRESERRMAALGAEYRLATRGRLYARHEFLSSFTTPWALTGAQQQLATVAGVDADVVGEAHLFGEYRMPQLIAGREAQAAVGLRNAWRVGDGARVGASFERVSPLRGNSAGASTAASASVDWTGSEAWKGSSRLEVRTSRASDQVVQSMAAAVRIDSLWTGLGRWLFTLTDARGGHGEAQARFQLAGARRGERCDALGRWEMRYDATAPTGEARHVRIANIATVATTARLSEWSGSLAWAGKRSMDRTTGTGAFPGGAQWLHARVARDIGRAWDAGLTGGVLTGSSLTQRQYGLGAEVGHVLPGGAWLSVGANRFGYQDDELTGETWTRQGAYVRLRVRVDESLLGRDQGVVR